MRKFLIDGGSMAFTVVLLAGLASFARSQSAAPTEAAEALEISAHARGCPMCRLPRFGPADRPSKLGPEPSWADRAPLETGEPADQRLLIYRAEPHATRATRS